MSTPAIIILAILVVANGTLAVSAICRRKNSKKQLEELRSEKKAAGLSESEIDDEDLKDEIEPQQRYSWIFGIVVCLDIWLLGAVFTHLWAEHYFTDVPDEDSRKALFGDSFGAVNALVSAFAFAGMIVAFILQRYELRLQRKELRDQRREFHQQNKTLSLQRFENTFFHMLELQQEIVADLSVKEEGKDWIEEDNPNPTMGRIRKQISIDRLFQGRDFFRYAFEEREHNAIDPQTEKKIQVLGMRSVLKLNGFVKYDSYYTTTYFDHYFRHFYRILKFIKQNEELLSFEEQYQYASMLRATLSRYELVWLYYNGLSENGCVKLKPLMEKYSMLKNLREDFLAISMENKAKFNAVGLKSEDVNAANFSCRDYEFFLTDQENDPTKYNIRAFYNEEELPRGNELLRRWRQFCQQYNINC